VRRRFIDTNVFLRFLLNDDPDKAAAIERLLTQAKRGEVVLVTTEMVLAEMVWVLETSYGESREGIVQMIEAIMAQPGIDVLGGKLVAEALDTYAATRMDFVDAYLLARMAEQGVDEIYSYDRKHLSKIPGVTRLEP